MTDAITIRAPDDWHVHVRDGAMLRAVLPFTARTFARAIVMPNLVPPVVTTADAVAYRERILAALPEGSSFTPLMTAYLRDDTDAGDIERGFRDGVLTAVKLYPAHATTNAAAGVTDIGQGRGRFSRAWRGSACRSSSTARTLAPTSTSSTVRRSSSSGGSRRSSAISPASRWCWSIFRPRWRWTSSGPTRRSSPAPSRRTTSPRTATDWLGHGLRPHLYCMPVIKTESDRVALVEAATSGEACFFLGTDSAPHALGRKLAPVCAAGVFNAPVALETYAEIFARPAGSTGWRPSPR